MKTEVLILDNYRKLLFLVGIIMDPIDSWYVSDSLLLNRLIIFFGILKSKMQFKEFVFF